MAENELRVALCGPAVLSNYTEALTEAGAAVGSRVIPVWFDCGKAMDGMRPFSEFRIADFDGLLLPGGGDIDPSLYGEENCGSIAPDIEPDRCQLAMLDAFVKARKPVLGICRGHQLVNVYFGGSLIQDIPEKKDHMRLNENDDNQHIIRAARLSVLYKLYADTFIVNSSHHQAVKEVGRGLRVTARCRDGVVEALEHRSLPILTVQFHPERMNGRRGRGDTADGGPIFVRFLHTMQRKKANKLPNA